MQLPRARCGSSRNVSGNDQRVQQKRLQTTVTTTMSTFLVIRPGANATTKRVTRTVAQAGVRACRGPPPQRARGSCMEKHKTMTASKRMPVSDGQFPIREILTSHIPAARSKPRRKGTFQRQTREGEMLQPDKVESRFTTSSVQCCRMNLQGQCTQTPQLKRKTR